MTSSSERALETRVSMLETEINNLKQQIIALDSRVQRQNIALDSRVTHLANELRRKVNKV
jgi:chaperonin cofactor prefoldin